MKRNGIAGFLRRKQYVIAGAIVAVAVVGTTMLYSSNQEKERQQLEAQLAEEMKESEQEVAVAEETEAAEQASAVIPPQTSVKNEVENGAELEDDWAVMPEDAEIAEEVAKEEAIAEGVEEVAVAEETLHFAPENGILWPMEGNVIINYSMDTTVYFATLEQYKYNPAVIIEGEVNDKVVSAAKGKVVDISTNEVTGCTMTVDLGDGYTAIYGQLKEPNFSVGDYVESGHVLGFVAEPTKYFAVEGSNLYFAMEKDGEPINPVEFFE